MSAPALDLARVRHAHLVGIGGMHMSAIAALLLARGVRVSGSDLQPSPYTRRLEALGATVAYSHAAEHIGGADLVIATVAVRPENPEIAAARARGIPVIVRAEAVAALMHGYRAICVAGTHGKTTTSALIAFALKHAGRDPAYLLGADVPDLGGNAAPGSGAEIVVEADEYAEAFLHYTPDIAVITNVDTDHLDYFRTDAAIDRAFAAFAARVRPGGRLICCADSPRLRAIARAVTPTLPAQLELYALDAADGAALWTARVESVAPEHTFSVLRGGVLYGRFTTPLAGRHNVANCLGAIAALDAARLAPEAIREAIARFRGARRRMETLGERDGVLVIDDYAHNPAKVAATLAAVRERYPGRRILVVFQPHTYSRTAYLLDRFATAFTDADLLAILPTYAARETPEAGLDAGALARAIAQPAPALLASYQDAVQWLRGHTGAGDIVLTLGAGPVDAVARAFLGEDEAEAKP